MNDLGLFLSEQGLSNAAFAAALEQIMPALGYPAERVAGETVRRWALPVGAPDFARPKLSCTQGIYVLTDGRVRPEAFADLPELDPKLRQRAEQILASVKTSFATRAKAARAKGGKAAARSTAKLRKVRAGAR